MVRFPRRKRDSAADLLPRPVALALATFGGLAEVMAEQLCRPLSDVMAALDAPAPARSAAQLAREASSAVIAAAGGKVVGDLSGNDDPEFAAYALNRVAAISADDNWSPYSSDPDEAAVQLLAHFLPEDPATGVVELAVVHRHGDFRDKFETAVGALSTTLRRSAKYETPRLVSAAGRYLSELSESELSTFTHRFELEAPRRDHQPGQFERGQILALQELQGERFVVADFAAGGMGTVLFRLPLNQQRMALAVKTYLPGTDPDAFELEARAWFGLNLHPNIARPVEFGLLEGRAYVAAEPYPASLAARAGSLEQDELIKALRQTAEALEFAAAQGILHRDIKPANILIDRAGDVRVSDFGLAQAVAAPATATSPCGSMDGAWLTARQPTGFAGTPAYMAPELFDHGRPSLATDMYALGITFIEVALGAHPLVDLEAGRLLLESPPEVLADLRSRYGPDVAELLRAMTASDARARPGSFREVVDIISAHPTRSREHLGRYSSHLTQPWIRRAGHHCQGPRPRGLGDSAAAGDLLTNELERRGEDPARRNALALTERDRNVGYGYLLRARRTLAENNGLYRGSLYLDPVMNLFRGYWMDAQFDAARTLMFEIETWVNAASKDDPAPGNFAELGWLYLVRGEFAHAVSHVESVYRSRVLVDESLQFHGARVVAQRNRTGICPRDRAAAA